MQRNLVCLHSTFIKSAFQKFPNVRTHPNVFFYLACYDYDKEYIGWDITNTGIVERDPYSCHKTCMKTRKCHAWTWYDNLCHLKVFKDKVKGKIGAVSGPKSCREYISNSDLLV